MTFSATGKTSNASIPQQQGAHIEILTAAFANLWPEWFCRKLLRLLADGDQKNVLKFRRWQDRQLKLLGRTLLLQALVKRGFPEDILKAMTFSAHGKPEIAGAPEFNISHSGSRAVCAISDQGAVGIDIEVFHDIDPADFQLALSPEEERQLRISPHKSRDFLALWTKKESTCKAAGRGLGVDLKAVCPANGQVQLNSRIFFVKDVMIVADYLCALATECPVSTICRSYQLIDPGQSFNPGNPGINHPAADIRP